MRDLDLDTDGAALHEGAALSILPALETMLADQPPDRAGLRLTGICALADLLTAGPVAGIAARHFGAEGRPVRAILFDKTPATNWALGWHQDRTIVVRERHATAGFGPWTVKAGLQHVEPPFAVIVGIVP